MCFCSQSGGGASTSLLSPLTPNDTYRGRTAPLTSKIYHHPHHHHILLSLQGYSASTKRRHLILFLTSCFTSFQLFSSPSASLCPDLLHFCLGHPLFRCPCGFQSITSLSMVSCPFLSPLFRCPCGFQSITSL